MDMSVLHLYRVKYSPVLSRITVMLMGKNSVTVEHPLLASYRMTLNIRTSIDSFYGKTVLPFSCEYWPCAYMSHILIFKWKSKHHFNDCT